jgi:hypothetical protein
MSHSISFPLLSSPLLSFPFNLVSRGNLILRFPSFGLSVSFKVQGREGMAEEESRSPGQSLPTVFLGFGRLFWKLPLLVFF